MAHLQTIYLYILYRRLCFSASIVYRRVLSILILLKYHGDRVDGGATCLARAESLAFPAWTYTGDCKILCAQNWMIKPLQTAEENNGQQLHDHHRRTANIDEVYECLYI